MNNTTSSIITIGREYGSAGRQIGQEVARYFGIKCYDKELLEHAANGSGICKELFENHDERPTNSFLYSLVMDTYSFGYSSSGFSDMPMNHKIFLAQFDAIKKLAEEGPCVMVGRCADYALSDWPDCFSIFIHADMDARIRRIASKYGKSDKEAKDMSANIWPASVLTCFPRGLVLNWGFWSQSEMVPSPILNTCLLPKR